jgi:hypothetical protein
VYAGYQKKNAKPVNLYEWFGAQKNSSGLTTTHAVTAVQTFVAGTAP